MLKLLRVKKIFSEDLVKVSALNGIATLIRMITAFVSVKVVAVLLVDPGGIALLGQLNNLSTLLLALANGGITAGVTKYVSQYSQSEKRYSLFIGTGFWITTIFSIIVGLILVIGARYWSNAILYDTKYTSVFYIFGLTIILYAFNTLLLAIVNGFKEFKKYVIVNILGSIAGLLFTIILTYAFGLYGALVAAITYQSVVLLVTLSLVHRERWFRFDNIRATFRKRVAGRLGHFAAMAIVAAIMVPVSQMLVRGFIVQAGTNGSDGNTLANLNEAGLWDSMMRVSNASISVIQMSLIVYYLPRLAELHKRTEIRHEIFKTYKFLLPAMIVMSLAIYLMRDFVIHLLFTEQFIGMRPLFGWQLTGDIIKMSGWVLGSLFLAKAMTKTFIAMEIGNYSLYAISGYYLSHEYGAVGACIAHVVSNTAYLVAAIIIFRKLLLNKPSRQFP